MLDKNIYNHIAQNTTKFEVFTTEDNEEKIFWIPIVYSNDECRIIGITLKGEWLIKANQKLFFMDTDDSFLFVISFLEMSIEEIKQQILRKINLDMFSVKFEQFFPVFNIIIAGLKNGQYWASLAMNWIESLEPKDKILLLKDLEVLTTTKWAGQNLRQRAYREMKKIKRYIDGQMSE